ncbi:MAG TPA: DUF6647 family protein [Burkholderiales bacterium]|jgi:hypothetical protein|nr:DUF6647 family protein [Burkholderiales bacterium]
MDASLTALVVDLYATLHLLAGYPRPAVLPDIHQVPQAQIRDRFCPGPCQIRAVYDPTYGVFIDESLDVKNSLFDRSILFHELVHHAQSVSGRFDLGDSACVRRNAAEKEAYFLQNRYLMEMNDGHRVSMTGWAARCSDAEVPTPGK